MTSPESLYKRASRISSHFYVPGYEKEDLIQECVLQVISNLRSQHSLTPALLNRMMRNRILSLIRTYYKNHPTNIDMGEINLEYIYVSSPHELIPVPISSPKVFHLVIALLENDFSLKETAHDLGWSTHKTYHVWERSKNLIRRSPRYLHDATISMAEEIAREKVA